MPETIMNLLQWLIPSGALGTVVIWLTNRTIRQARTAKEVHDTYKLMYEDVQKTLIELRREYDTLYKGYIKFERAFSKANACRYWSDHCPVRRELLYNKEFIAKSKTTRRIEDKREVIHTTFGSSRLCCSDEDPDTEPP